MRILSQTAAGYFCNGFSPVTLVSPIDDLVTRVGRRTITEGTTLYNQYRDNVLRDCERSYYVAVSLFRRAHDSMLASAIFWGHVALYYSNWYAARVVLGTHGAWADSRRVVGVVHEGSGAQQFRVSDNPYRQQGSHKAFWSEYYNSVAPLRLSVDPSFVVALDPITANVHWQIEARNRVNYTLSELQRLSDAFRAKFDPAQFPLSLPGDTATQFEVTRTTLRLAAELLTSLGVATDVFPRRGTSIQSDIFDALSPELLSSNDIALFAV